MVADYPIAVGKKNRTPEGEFKIISKVKDPYWKVPKSIRKQAERKKENLPELMKPYSKNKNNPIGVYWLGLSIKKYGIHGTNDPNSIGKAVSHGCIRMYNKDIKKLAEVVKIGTKVEIKQRRQK